MVTLRHTSGPFPGRPIKPEPESGSEATYIDVSLLVAQEEVVHDGAIVQVLESRHVLHASDAAVVHGLHLLPAQRILLVGVHLKESIEKEEKRQLWHLGASQDCFYSF